MLKGFIATSLILFSYRCIALHSDGDLAFRQHEQRWELTEDGGIAWAVSPGDVHEDFIEMSGEQIALLIRYGVDEKGSFTVSHAAVWPTLRFRPNLTESHLRVTFGEDTKASPSIQTGFSPRTRFGLGLAPEIFVREPDGWLPLSQRTLRRVHHKGVARFEGTMGPQLSFQRAIFPSVDKPAAFDTTILTNVSLDDVELSIDGSQRTLKTSPARGVYGGYIVTERVISAGSLRLRPGESTTVTVVFEAYRERDAQMAFDIPAEERARIDRVNELFGKLQLETPDPVLNTTFAFAKLHAAESIFRTKGGLMHSPGGGMGYYAAIWANDQAEYANPFFGMLGDATATAATLNSFRHFARFMNPEYRPIPSSIIAEGESFWNDAGDRGDMAMIAYGAARFALANGDKRAAEELWPLIEWSLEYLRRKLTPEGVVASDSDELEDRFPAGKANLCTSSLYYDALRSAVMLGKALGKSRRQLDNYATRAAVLRTAIERYFGANVEGFETYRYYDKADLVGGSPDFAAYAARPDVLRAWIAIPLTMGIFDRKAGTIDALFSPRLWTADGLATEAGQNTFWDRSTLYGLRGVLAAGDTKRGVKNLVSYSRRRLLGDHVPYPFEAYPEGGKSQLAAESALYCRVFTEGLFGMRPTGLRSFTLTPQLPEGWATMALRQVHAFGSVFDLSVERNGAHDIAVTLDQKSGRKHVYMMRQGTTTRIDVD